MPPQISSHPPQTSSRSFKGVKDALSSKKSAPELLNNETAVATSGRTNEAIVSDTGASCSSGGGRQIGLEQFDLIKVIGKTVKEQLNKVLKLPTLYKIQIP